MALDVHIVSHTHWDREWYHPFERFRLGLVALIDDLLNAPPSSGEGFLLDGQTVLLDDYLAVRPERAAELVALLRDGRLEAGPWFVLADELIPSGEALIRNLLTGRRTLRRLRADSPPVLYCPDSFGHPAALPEIAAGFGLPVIILWRGYGGPRWPAGDTVRWEAASGNSALLFHLPRDGYEFGSHLPIDPTAAADRWARMRAELAPRSVTGVTLVPNGADHHARQLHLDDALNALERAGAGDNVHRSSLRAFAEQLVAESGAHQLPVVRVELRDSYGYAWTLQGTFATRAHEKRLNARAQRLLLRDAEPWAALAAGFGTSRRALVDAAWRDLLTAHPHDTLCGCSIDPVASAMEGRINAAMSQASGIRDCAIFDLVGHDPVEAREHRERWRPVIVVRNPAPRARSGVAIVDVEEFLADVPVGPGSALAPIERESPRAGKVVIPDLGPVQVLSRDVRYSRTESPQHYPDNDLVSVQRVAAWVDDAPGYGVITARIGGHSRSRRHGPERPVATTARSLENAKLRIAVDEVGSVTLEQLEDPQTRRIESLLQFVDEEDIGDLYTPAPRPLAFSVQFRGVRRIHLGPLRGELSARYRIVDAATGRAAVDLDVRLILDADASFVRIHVHGENRRTGHRVRLQLRGDVVTPQVWADAAFGSVRREPIVVLDPQPGDELPPATAPLHRYVSLFDDRVGFTLFSDGLAEYEARDDSILVTLVRGVGELSRNDLPERPGHAGWPTPTPAAQCLGEFACELAVMLHGPRGPLTVDAIERAADDVLNPITGVTLRSAISPRPRVEGIALAGPGLAFSAAKQSEDGEWTVLRCVNLLDEQVSGSWRLPFAVHDARLARLDETILSELRFDGLDVPFVARPRAVVTILVR